MLIEIIFLQELSKDLSSNPHQLPAKVILIQKIGFSTKKKKKKFIMNKSSSPLLHLYLHLLRFLKMNKSSYFKKKKKRNKKRRKLSKKALGLGALGSYFLGFFQKKFKIFNSLKKFKISNFFKKNHQSKISIPWKNSRFPKFSKKKKKKGNYQKRP